jgi:predicted DsbA family dithiol-disulfide isomerase
VTTSFGKTNMLKIDFVSDVACPWCAVGLNALEEALRNLGPDIPVTLQCQPFELNPKMASEGANAADYLKAKYGMSDAQLAQARATLHERGAAVGFHFGTRSHVWNTFDAHRLLHWAGLQDADHRRQRALKHALLTAYHGQGRNPGASDVLLELAVAAGLDATEARAVIEDKEAHAADVRDAERFWQEAGINAVPAVVINQRHLISGGQPSAVFEQALRQIAAEA